MVSEKDFGRDHWNLLAYVETCCVDRGGQLDIRRLRCDPTRHAMNAHAGWLRDGGEKYPTRLRHGEMHDHDDWDCLEDLEAAGLVVNVCTLANPLLRLTERGWTVSAALRRHLADGGVRATFTGEGKAC